MPRVLKASLLDSGELACVGMLSRKKLKGSWRNVEIRGEAFKFFGSSLVPQAEKYAAQVWCGWWWSSFRWWGWWKWCSFHDFLRIEGTRCIWGGGNGSWLYSNHQIYLIRWWDAIVTNGEESTRFKTHWLFHMRTSLPAQLLKRPSMAPGICLVSRQMTLAARRLIRRWCWHSDFGGCSTFLKLNHVLTQIVVKAFRSVNLTFASNAVIL